MSKEIIIGLILPFLGTTLGAALVFFMKKQSSSRINKILIGFAAGVMVAASIWSLIIPAIDMSESWGKWSFVPAAIGFAVGVVFLLIADSLLPHMHYGSTEQEGIHGNFKKRTMLVFAVALHNVPEGMAVGVALAGAYYGNSVITMAGALTLAVGIALQNFPEGAIVSMPLKDAGMSKAKSFGWGVFSGVLEPIAAIITILLVKYVEGILPYMLAFAAGAMIYVVVEELIPESQEGKHTNWATVALMLGFIVMMILDVALG